MYDIPRTVIYMPGYFHPVDCIITIIIVIIINIRETGCSVGHSIPRIVA